MPVPRQVSVLGPENPLPPGVVNKYVNILRFKDLLSDHPDQSLVASIVAGFEFGFDIGFRGVLTDQQVVLCHLYQQVVLCHLQAHSIHTS